MFNKLKQFKELRDRAKTVKNILAQEHITLERNGITITMNGNMEIETLKLNPELPNEKQEEQIKELINEAIGKVQRIMAEKMRQMGGLDNLNIPGM